MSASEMPAHPRVDPGTLTLAAAWQWTPAGVATLAATVVFVGLAAYVWRRRGGSAGAALALVLVAVLLWAAAYAAELGATELAVKQRWGDFKYVGICLLPPAWFAFAALFSGRGQWVNRRNLVLLAVEPVLVLALLANRATHDLIRFYPSSAVGDQGAVARPGPLFWPHLAYNSLVLWVSLGLMVAALLRASSVYRKVSLILIASLIAPYVLNLLYNFDIGPFGRVDLTPFAFTASCLVLVWGLFRFRLLGISPVARGVVFETITDAVVVLDPLRRVVDANPAPPWRTPPAGPLTRCSRRPPDFPRTWPSPGAAPPVATSSPACPCPTGRARRSAGWWSSATSPSATGPSATCAASTSSAVSCWSGW